MRTSYLERLPAIPLKAATNSVAGGVVHRLGKATASSSPRPVDIVRDAQFTTQNTGSQAPMAWTSLRKLGKLAPGQEESILYYFIAIF